METAKLGNKTFSYMAEKCWCSHEVIYFNFIFYILFFILIFFTCIHIEANRKIVMETLFGIYTAT